MSLERKDVRFKLQPDTHQGLSVLADVAGMDIAEWCEAVISKEVAKQVHEASVIHERTSRLGISGILSGKSGRDQE